VISRPTHWATLWIADSSASSLAKRAVDHDFGDGLISQQRLQRAKPQDFGLDLVKEALALGAAEDDVFLSQDGLEQLLHSGLDFAALARHIHGRIQLGEQLGLDARPDIYVTFTRGRRACWGRALANTELRGQPGLFVLLGLAAFATGTRRVWAASLAALFNAT